MKQKLYYKIGLFIVIASMFISCDKWIDTEININPNNPGDVTMDGLLSSAQAAIAYTYGGDLTRIQAIWMQHLSGVNRQSFATERYSVLDSDINNLWRTLYSGALMNLKVIDKKALEADAIHYLGVSKVLQAHSLLNITSVWGDVPFSEAFKADFGIIAPRYDSQEQIFSTINELLDDAIELFEQTSPLGIPRPGRDDLIFKGNISLWEKTAKTLKVRAALHLAKRNGYGPARDLIDEGGLMVSNTDDFQFVFGTSSNEWNPRFQFDNDRADVRAGKRIVDLMNDTNDPRLPLYFTSVGVGYLGSGPGEANSSTSFAGPGYASQNSPVFFLTFFELKFIEAEAFFGEDNIRAANAYNQAVKASLAKHNVSNIDWEDLYANEDFNSITLETIMTGKYIAMFYNLETWADWRRTGLPVLQIPIGNVLTETPRRYLYPLDENLYNSSNVPPHSAISRVWWDI